MADKDITQVLQYIVENGSGACDKCPVFPCGKIKDYEDNQCGRFIAENALDLISRQKAENERLNKANSLCVTISFDRDELQEIADKCVKNIEIDINLAKADAIKDFAERLKNKIKTECNPYGKPTFDYDTSISIMRYIDNLVKEMVGENND